MNEDRDTDTATNAQHDNAGVALGDKTQSGPDYQAVHIHCHSVRKRLVDADAVSIKAALDGIVKAGVLQDDSTRFVKTVAFSQEKGQEEKTIITITEALQE